MFLAISKCPLDETGKNSVKPWIIPKMKASSLSIFYLFEDFKIA